MFPLQSTNSLLRLARREFAWRLREEDVRWILARAIAKNLEVVCGFAQGRQQTTQFLFLARKQPVELCAELTVLAHRRGQRGAKARGDFRSIVDSGDDLGIGNQRLQHLV